MERGHRALFVAALGACIGGCGGSHGDGAPAAPVAPPTPVHVEGAVQKGPFLVGSTVLINRRDARGGSTGSTILSEIEDSIGSFDFVTTDPGLLQIVATGYYFSELTGQVSNGTLTLRALYEITDRPGQKAHVNIMTHLINDRVLSLLAAGNIDAAGAMTKAEAELVKAFQRRAARRGRRRVLRLERLQHERIGGSRQHLSARAIHGILRIRCHQSGGVRHRDRPELTLMLNRISDDLAADGDIDTTGFIRDFTRAIRSLSPETITDNLRKRAIVDYPAGLDVPDISVFLNLCAGNFACPWRAGAPMPQETVSHATAVHGGKAYLFGGFTSADDTCGVGFCVPGDAFREVYAYDPVANAWEPRAPLPVGMAKWALTPSATDLCDSERRGALWQPPLRHGGVEQCDLRVRPGDGWLGAEGATTDLPSRCRDSGRQRQDLRDRRARRAEQRSTPNRTGRSSSRLTSKSTNRPRIAGPPAIQRRFRCRRTSCAVGRKSMYSACTPGPQLLGSVAVRL